VNQTEPWTGLKKTVMFCTDSIRFSIMKRTKNKPKEKEGINLGKNVCIPEAQRHILLVIFASISHATCINYSIVGKSWWN